MPSVNILSIAFINGFNIAPEEVTPGEDVTISWSLNGEPETLIISDELGNMLDLTGKDKESDMIIIKPITTNTYTLTATFGGNTLTQSATVTVGDDNFLFP